MNRDAEVKIVADFLASHFLGVIATASPAGGAPESALIAFSERPDLSLVFGSFAGTRKNENIAHNPHVSFVIGEASDGGRVVQYEGEARELAGAEAEGARRVHLAKNPSSKKYTDAPEERFFEVRPHWIRYSNLAENPPRIFEISF